MIASMATAAVEEPKAVRLCSKCHLQEPCALQQVSVHNLSNSFKGGLP